MILIILININREKDGLDTEGGKERRKIKGFFFKNCTNTKNIFVVYLNN